MSVLDIPVDDLLTQFTDAFESWAPLITDVKRADRNHIYIFMETGQVYKFGVRSDGLDLKTLDDNMADRIKGGK